MLTEITLFSAFLTGLLGSIHCIGMCGGILGALTMGLPPSIKQSPLKLLPYLFAYNLGRIGSYVIAGCLVGFLGSQITPFLPYQIHLWVSALFMIALGLYISGWWSILVNLEKLGAHLWYKISPLGQRFLPITQFRQAFGLGLVWGWLPCGLVYTALVLSLASGSAIKGGLLMFAFGLGTLPMLFVIGTTAQWLMQWTNQRIIRQILGSLIILFGIYLLFGASHHTHHRIQGIEMCYF